jgi:hypothetical protein
VRVTINGSGAILTHGDSLSGGGVIEFPINEPPEFASTLANYSVTGSAPSRKLKDRGHEIAVESPTPTAERAPSTGSGVTVTDGTTTVAATTVQTTGTVTDAGAGTALVSNGGGTGVPSSWTFNDNGEVNVSPTAGADLPLAIEAPDAPGDTVFSVGSTGETRVIGHDVGLPALTITVPNGQTAPRLRVQDGNGVEFFVNGKGNVSYQVGVGATSALDIFDENGDRIFKVAADGSVHIKTGTSIVADL